MRNEERGMWNDKIKNLNFKIQISKNFIFVIDLKFGFLPAGRQVVI